MDILKNSFYLYDNFFKLKLMSNNQPLLFQLEELLRWKKSKKVYAEKLGITEDEVSELLKELRKKEEIVDSANIDSGLKKFNKEKGTVESVITVDFEPKDDVELAKLHKIDLNKYVITNYWTKLLPNGKFTSSVFCKIKKPEDYSPEDFIKFLEKYKPNGIKIKQKGANLTSKFTPFSNNFITINNMCIFLL